MSDTKHTPAPWSLVKEDGDRIIYASGDSLMCDAPYYPWCPKRDADWNLIAAAPELLAALKKMLPENNRRDEHLRPNFETCEEARAAIAKAEGRS